MQHLPQAIIRGTRGRGVGGAGGKGAERGGNGGEGEGPRLGGLKSHLFAQIYGGTGGVGGESLKVAGDGGRAHRPDFGVSTLSEGIVIPSGNMIMADFCNEYLVGANIAKLLADAGFQTAAALFFISDIDLFDKGFTVVHLAELKVALRQWSLATAKARLGLEAPAWARLDAAWASKSQAQARSPNRVHTTFVTSLLRLALLKFVTLMASCESSPWIVDAGIARNINEDTVLDSRATESSGLGYCVLRHG
ncbi:hypothetical protein C8R43DRAFT_947317 [Mycena crocata]|nr:hypothetical protein C8R43DRAFT_947317 [Mycena crocata]